MQFQSIQGPTDPNRRHSRGLAAGEHRKVAAQAARLAAEAQRRPQLGETAAEVVVRAHH